MPGFPFDVKIELTFSPATTVNPTWVDVSEYVLGFSTERGRAYDTDACEPGRITVRLDNSDGRFDPDNTAGPYSGSLRPNRRVRISVMHTSSSPRVFLAQGYVDSWVVSWPGGGVYSETTLEATDRFKLIARQTFSALAGAETATTRINNILLNKLGLTAGEVEVNANGLASRNLGRRQYQRDNALGALQEIAFSDGGVLFVNGAGLVVFQTVKYREIGGSVRATTSQGTFGNAAGAIPVQDDLAPAVDDQLMANQITITDNTGKVFTVGDGTAQANDGLLEFDLGSTLLARADAQDRASDLLLKRKNPLPRVAALVLDALTDDLAMAQALNREISDRITLSLAPPGYGSTRSRPQFVESVAHDVTFGREWFTTLQISAV